MKTAAYRSGSLLAVCALALAACEGVNRFSGPALADPDAPVVVEVVVPELIRPGGVLEVEVTAAAAAGVVAVDLTLIEDVVRERRLTIDPPDPSPTAFAEFQMPERLIREIVELQVEVEDAQGGRSEPVEVRIPVFRDTGTF